MMPNNWPDWWDNFFLTWRKQSLHSQTPQLWLLPHLWPARFFAEKLPSIWLCEPQDDKPCQGCSNCRKLAARQVMVLAWEKQISVESIREKQSWWNLHSDYPKLLIIPSVKRLTHAAQQILLALCEQPPQGLHIVCITDYTWRLIPTLRSRLCLQLLPKPSVSSLANSLSCQMVRPIEEVDRLLKQSFSEPYIAELMGQSPQNWKWLPDMLEQQLLIRRKPHIYHNILTFQNKTTAVKQPESWFFFMRYWSYLLQNEWKQLINNHQFTEPHQYHAIQMSWKLWCQAQTLWQKYQYHPQLSQTIGWQQLWRYYVMDCRQKIL